MKDLFFSYASEDKDDLVRPVSDALRRLGLSIWLDEGEIIGGMDFVEAIQSGISESQAVVVFLTSTFFKKRWPQMELRSFISIGKPIIPIAYGISLEDIKRESPLLASIKAIIDVRDPQEIAQRIVRAYNASSMTEGLDFCTGIIRLPADSATVDRHIPANGEIYSVSESCYAWLVVEIGELKWPKGRVNISGNSWKGEAYEGGTPPNGEFMLSLYVTGKTGDREASKWLEIGRRTGNYDGLSIIRDGTRLDSVKLSLRESLSLNLLNDAYI